MEIQILGEHAIVLSVSYDTISTSVSVLRQLHHALLKAEIPGITSMRPGLDCMLVEFEDNSVPSRIEKELRNIKLSPRSERASSEIIRIPVCYEPEFGTDLSSVASKTGLNPDSIMQLHSSKIYKVWMIGFMPGFPYLGELPADLQLPRKATPDLKLAAGSVAIAEEFVGVYPFDSPGGWHVLGRTPLRLADYKRSDPWLFRYGMSVQFYPVTKDEFEQIKQENDSQ